MRAGQLAGPGPYSSRSNVRDRGLLGNRGALQRTISLTNGESLSFLFAYDPSVCPAGPIRAQTFTLSVAQPRPNS